MSEFVKLVIFVPRSHGDAVRQALGDAGAGKLGNYSHCSYSSAGAGRFKPLEGAHPAIGKVGLVEEVEEEKVESICKRSKAREVLATVRIVHPYEEMAFDIFPLLSEEEL